MPSLLLALVLAALAVGCPAEEEQVGCKTDVDCPSGRVCSGGTCGPPAQAGGSGGEVVVPDECGTSADCVPAPFSIVPTVTWDGSLDGSDQVCIVPQRSCQGSALCDVPTVCADVLSEAARLGGMRCERDDQCAGNRCVPLPGGVSICLRACVADGDCPATLGPDGRTQVGLVCGDVVQAGIPLRLCVPIDPAHEERTLCRSDCDCPADGCPADESEPLCRFVGDSFPPIEGVPLCDRAQVGLTLRPTLAQCKYEPTSCHGGACIAPCQINVPGSESFCREPPYRCTQPCDADRDCPARTACRDGTPYERVGTWMLPQQDFEAPGRSVRYCQLPKEGCYDEIDCCPEPDGQGGCVKGWSPDRKRCSVELVAPLDNPRVMSTCLPIDPGLAGPGECCDEHASCDSNLCVPGRAGTPCAGRGVCSVPCDPDPFPYGTPGSFDDRDRCTVADFAPSSYHQGSSCQPFHYAHAYTDRNGAAATVEVELNACQ